MKRYSYAIITGKLDTEENIAAFTALLSRAGDMGVRVHTIHRHSADPQWPYGDLEPQVWALVEHESEATDA